MADRKPILCLDYDGVCTVYSGWKGAAVTPDPPVPGMWEFLEQAVQHFQVMIFSSRSNSMEGRHAMAEWFLQQATTEAQRDLVQRDLGFPSVKPPAFISLDDRCLLFTGVFPPIQTLIEFKPWTQYERPPAPSPFPEVSMPIDAPPGTPVCVTPWTRGNGYTHDRERVAAHLCVGLVYHVDHIRVKDTRSEVYLREIPGISFNSVNLCLSQEGAPNGTDPSHAR